MTFDPIHTGIIPEADAELQQEVIKGIMAERRITFQEACDVFIIELGISPVASSQLLSERRVPRYERT